jgi:hypothetical protein
VFLLVEDASAGDDGVVSEREPGPVVVTLVWALDEVFIGFAGRPVAVVRRELEEACEVWDCRLDEDTLDVFAAEIAAGERVEIDAGTIRVPPGGSVEVDWLEAPF